MGSFEMNRRAFLGLGATAAVAAGEEEEEGAGRRLLWPGGGARGPEMGFGPVAEAGGACHVSARD